MKKITKLCIVGIFIGLLIPLKVQALVSPTSDFYINDYANILSEETKNYILNKSVALEKETTAQIVVVTVPNLEDKSLEEYATELFRKFGIGDKEKNNGVLILVAKNDHKARIEVGYGLEGDIPDGKAGRILKSMLNDFKKDKYDEGIKLAYGKLANEIYKAHGDEAHANVEDNNNLTFMDCVIMTIFVIIIILVIIAIIFGNGGSGGGYYGGGSWGGGSSWSSGDSGGSWGGGSSGGGGASGSW